MLSIAEFIIYGSLTYVTFILVLVHALQGKALTGELNIQRFICIIPGMVSAGILATANPVIKLWTTNITPANFTAVSNYKIDVNGTLRDVQSTVSQTYTKASETGVLELQSDIFVLVHMMFFWVLFFFGIMQILTVWIAIPGARK